jgi:hypothetical protein
VGNDPGRSAAQVEQAQRGGTGTRARPAAIVTDPGQAVAVQ